MCIDGVPARPPTQREPRVCPASGPYCFPSSALMMEGPRWVAPRKIRPHPTGCGGQKRTRSNHDSRLIPLKLDAATRGGCVQVCPSPQSLQKRPAYRFDHAHSSDRYWDHRRIPSNMNGLTPPSIFHPHFDGFVTQFSCIAVSSWFHCPTPATVSPLVGTSPAPHWRRGAWQGARASLWLGRSFSGTRQGPAAGRAAGPPADAPSGGTRNVRRAVQQTLDGEGARNYFGHQ